MVAVDAQTFATTPTPSRRRRNRPRFGRGLVLLLAAVYFVGPIAAAFWFSINSDGNVDWHAYSDIPDAPGFGTAVVLSLEVALIAVAISLLLMVPTTLLIHLRFTRARAVVEVLSLLPLVVPPVVLVVGVGKVIAWGNTDDTTTLRFAITNQLLNSDPPLILPLIYVVLAMPFTFRALDAGLRASSLTTLTEAARNLGAGWLTILWRVALPVLRSAIITAALLAFALAFGEFTVASILQDQTFTVWLLQFDNTDGQLSVALSLMSLALTWVLLMVFTALSGRTPGTSRKERR